MNAWLDRTSGLIWTDPIEWTLSDRPTVDEAKAFCRSQPPAGHWALPTAAELTLFWQDGGEAISPSGSWGGLSVIVDVTFQMELPSLDLGNGRGFAIRCVARSPTAPERGYIKDDIELEVWNRYQLDKLTGSQTNPPHFNQ